MLMSKCVGGLAWLMAHIANSCLVVRTGAKKFSRNKEALRECCEGMRLRESKVAGDCIVSLWGKGKYSWGLILLADIFTKAEEQGRGKKIAFESATVNLKKGKQHLLY